MVQIGRPSIVQRHGQLERFTGSLIVQYVEHWNRESVTLIATSVMKCWETAAARIARHQQQQAVNHHSLFPTLHSRFCSWQRSDPAHCSTAALQARCQDTVTRRHSPTLNSAICIDIRMARGGARTRRRGECCILHSPWPGARQLVVCPAVRCFLVLIGKIILLTSLGMITRKQELPSLWDRNYVSQFIWFFNCIATPTPNETPGPTPNYKSSNMYDHVIIYLFLTQQKEFLCMCNVEY